MLSQVILMSGPYLIAQWLEQLIELLATQHYGVGL